jgi:hypothetical protein
MCRSSPEQFQRFYSLAVLTRFYRMSRITAHKRALTRPADIRHSFDMPAGEIGMSENRI